MKNIVQLSKSLDEVPNTSYLPTAISREVRRYLEQFEMITVAEDHLAVYAHYNKGNPNHEIIIDSHLDHPGFVMQSQSEAVAVGSIAGKDEIPYLQESLPFPVSIYDQSGSYTDQAFITNLSSVGGKTIATIETDKQTGRFYTNSHAILNVGAEQSEDSIYLRSADNLAVTACALEVAEWLNSARPEASVTFIFPKMEEIRQGAASLIAKRNGTPFGQFSNKTMIVVLEAGLMGETEQTKVLTNIATDYNNGPVVRIGDNELAFMLANQPNLAESTLLHAIQSLGFNFQHGSSVSNSDATSYTLFSQCPNVVGITVPCLNKHNMNREVGFTHEEVRIDDLTQTYVALQEIILRSLYEIIPHSDAIISPDREFPWNNEAYLKSKRKLWSATAEWAEPRLKIARLFPEGLSEKTQLMAGSIRSRLGRES